MGTSLNCIEVAGSHFEIGLAIGERFVKEIHRACKANRPALKELLAYQSSPEGQARYRELVDLNRACYPGYFAELEGTAQGAQQPFEDLFLSSMRGEYLAYLRASRPGPDGCSDCSLVTDEFALIGHNEDGSPAFRDSMYLIQARPEGKPTFTAFCYPGFLPGNAFGFNSEGICFSADDVQPRAVRAGIGRNFIARSLLEARSLQDAIERVTIPGRASGFSFTIGSLSERRVVQVEMAPNTHHVREIPGANYHANHYQELAGVDQIIEPSSQARVERARALLQDSLPVDAAGVLAILGDQADGQYPIYRQAVPPDQLMTYCTALFDLDARQLQIFTDHPTLKPQECTSLVM